MLNGGICSSRSDERKSIVLNYRFVVDDFIPLTVGNYYKVVYLVGSEMLQVYIFVPGVKRKERHFVYVNINI